MAAIPLTNAKVVASGSTLPHVASVVINYNAAMLDNTEMGNTTKSSTPGLYDWSIDVEMWQEYGSSQVDAILWPLVGAAAFTVTVNPINSANATTNPAFSGSAVLKGYSPITGKVGDLQKVKATFMSAGTLTRATS